MPAPEDAGAELPSAGKQFGIPAPELPKRTPQARWGSLAERSPRGHRSTSTSGRFGIPRFARPPSVIGALLQFAHITTASEFPLEILSQRIIFMRLNPLKRNGFGMKMNPKRSIL